MTSLRPSRRPPGSLLAAGATPFKAWVAALAAALPTVALSAVNLITNPGNDLALVADEIPGWVETVGSQWGQRSGDPLPQAGTAYFFAGAVAQGELSQLISLAGFADWLDSGSEHLDFAGYIHTWPQEPSDTARVVVELLDASGAVLASQDTGELSNTSAWQAISLDLVPPTGTRQARIRLLAQRYAGSNNDGYLDSLSLAPRITGKKLGGTLAGAVPQGIECLNKTTGAAASSAVKNTWRCGSAGLQYQPGDKLEQRVSSVATSAIMPIGMAAHGMKVKKVSCENLTSGQLVQITDRASQWDCAAAGLVMSSGDLVLQTVSGLAR